MTDSWFDQVHDLTLKLVAQPSVTHTPGEVAFAAQLHAILAAQPYFQAHPDHVWIALIADDPHGRSNVYALVRGSDPATLVLAGHYDVVSVANYGALAAWACDPAALLPRLIDDLRTTATHNADRLALGDLESGAYLPGRGALDMKSGLAAGIAVLLRWAERSDRRGNLLLIATPDEEVASYGMRAAAQQLPVIAREHGLDLLAAINLDSEADAGDGSDGRAVFLGSVGKLLASVYVVGRDTHAGAPFDGINAALLAAHVTHEIEGNPRLSDVVAGEASPPPVCLQQIDLKDYYDVTTPRAAWCTYNVLTHGRSADDVLAIVRRLVEHALDAATDQMRQRAAQWAELHDRQSSPRAWQPIVLSFADLIDHVVQHGGTAAQQQIADLTDQIGADRSLSLPQASLRITDQVWAMSGLRGPAAVVGIASLYYPPVRLDLSRDRHRRLHDVAAHHAATLAAQRDQSIRLRPFFTGISDMSFLGFAATAAEIATVARNTPVWKSRIKLDAAALNALDLPVINIGPWGRDPHQRTERVNMPYSFETVPELIWRVANDLLDGSDRA